MRILDDDDRILITDKIIRNGEWVEVPMEFVGKKYNLNFGSIGRED